MLFVYVVITDNKPKLKDVLNATDDVVVLYKLGVQLDISMGVLDTIHSNNSNDVEKEKGNFLIIGLKLIQNLPGTNCWKLCIK